MPEVLPEIVLPFAQLDAWDTGWQKNKEKEAKLNP